jgi:hypothetical protein
MSSGFVYVMYNTCYGGFSLSDAAVDEFRRRCPEALEVNARNVERHDPVMVQIVREMGAKANGMCAKIELKRIPAEYQNHYKIGEYDGLEGVQLQYNKYRVDAVREILKDRALSKSDKLARIAAVMALVDQERDEENDD